MTSEIRHVTFDARDAYAQGVFWSAVLGYADEPQFPNSPGDPESLIVSRDGTSKILFVNVPEQKSLKNRVHLDIAPTDRTRDKEVERLLALGATLHDDRRLADGRGWVVLRDPEGNELCVERSDAERS